MGLEAMVNAGQIILAAVLTPLQRNFQAVEAANAVLVPYENHVEVAAVASSLVEG